jgi:curved DNA-binding protein CbpA
MNTNATADFYQLLQVDFSAKKADIISAYRRLSKLYHPDISGAPQAQELMARINTAYDTLSNDRKRQAYNNTLSRTTGSSAARAVEMAQKVISEYFNRLLLCDYNKAFQLLCPSDRRQVGLRAFREWRQAVEDLYAIHEFNIRPGLQVTNFVLEKNRSASAVKFFVDVLEKDHVSGRTEHYCFTKYVVFEQGQPGVHLGYRDLGEISQSLYSLSHEREQTQMRENWQRHLLHHDRVTGLLSRNGLLSACKAELYRAQRYKGRLTVAVLSLQAARLSKHKLSGPCLEAAAQALKKSLRLTDTAAHVGKGVFAVLFFELKKRHATLIVERALKRAEHAASALCKESLSAAFAYEPYNGGSLEGYLDRLCAKLEVRG